MFSSASTTSWRPDGTGWGTHMEACSGRGGVRAEIHDHGQQVRPGDAVHQRVMGLGQDGPPPVFEPLDHPDLPEGFRAVELLCHDPPDELAQLALAAGGGQRGVAEVVLDVEVGIVHPDRPPELQGDEADLLAVARDEVELALHHRDDVLGKGRRGALEDGDRGDVHVGHVVLDVEERRIEGAQPVRAHRPPFRALPARTLLPAVVDLRGQPACAAATGSPREVSNGVARIVRRVSS